MNVKRLKFENFLKHKKTEVQLPDSGIVLVTGANGEGKSTVIDACYAAISGDSIRGGDMVHKGSNRASVSLETDKFSSTVTISKRTSFAWNFIGSTPVQYETTTKAFKALEKVVDPKIWARTNVFRSNTETFGSSTDSERKKFLERLIGLDVYTEAYTLASKDANAAARSLSDVQATVNLLSERISNLYEQLAQLQEFKPAPAEDPESIRERIQVLEQQVADLRAEDRQLARELAERRDAITRLSSQLEQAKRQRNLAYADRCPTCGQATTSDMRCTADHAVAEAQNALSAARLAEEPSTAPADLLREVEDQLYESRSQYNSARTAFTSADTVSKKIEAVTVSVDRATVDLLKSSSDLAEIEKRCKVLGQVVTVLSTKGYRAHLLGNTLAAIETRANEILWKMTLGKIQVSLKPFSETKKGDLTTDINFQITSGGDELSFKSLSSGQQRRVEVALVLGAASLSNSGTLFFDEIFDALDVDGVDRLCEVLAELSATRCVVVITHSAELTGKLPADVKLKAINNTYVREK
jgi:DNA repair exonuclease SbcCD ATPase subunit